MNTAECEFKPGSRHGLAALYHEDNLVSRNKMYLFLSLHWAHKKMKLEFSYLKLVCNVNLDWHPDNVWHQEQDKQWLWVDNWHHSGRYRERKFTLNFHGWKVNMYTCSKIITKVRKVDKQPYLPKNYSPGNTTPTFLCRNHKESVSSDASIY